MNYSIIVIPDAVAQSKNIFKDGKPIKKNDTYYMSTSMYQKIQKELWKEHKALI